MHTIPFGTQSGGEETTCRASQAANGPRISCLKAKTEEFLSSSVAALAGVLSLANPTRLELIGTAPCRDRTFLKLRSSCSLTDTCSNNIFFELQTCS